MNAWSAPIMWCTLQVTLLAAFGLVLRAALRRRGPAAGALVSIGTLLVVLAITLLVAVPLPAGWNVSNVVSTLTEWRNERANRRPLVAGHATPEVTTEVTAAAPDGPAGTSLGETAGMAEFWNAFVDEMRRAPVEQSRSPRRWPIAVLVVFAIGAALGTFRLLAGATAVRSYRRHSRPIADEALDRLAQTLCAENDCRQNVEVRETNRLSTPATVGCFSPLILLPDGWRDWTCDELRAVLAHEIAHVARGDYLSGLLAQVTLALHFYHPLVHWLVRQMRFDQELAADARGMRASGGHDLYLATLAGMALRQDDRAISWAARPFLPTRGTFMRRIEMLRDSRKQVNASLPRGGRALLIGTVALVGLLVAGLRLDGPSELQAQAPAATTDSIESSRTQLSLDYVPTDAQIVAAVAPAKVLGRPGMATVRTMINGQFESMHGFPVEQLEQLTIALLMDQPRRQETCLILRSVAPRDWNTLMGTIGASSGLEAVQFGGREYVRVMNHPLQNCLFMVDDRTLVIQPESRMKAMITNLGQAKPVYPFADLWAKVAVGDALVIGPTEWLGSTSLSAEPLALPFGPLWRDTRTIAVGIGLEDHMEISGYVECKNPEDAPRVAQTLEAVRTLLQNAEPEMRKGPAAQAGVALPFLDILSAVVHSATLTTSGNLVKLTAEGSADVPGASTALAALTPAITAARESARRAQSINNLKQIALAMVNFENTYGFLPPPVVIGPDGKTPHSWRVALLPYIDQDALYKEYKLDEPWDSDNNKKVLAKIPAIYRHPSHDEQGTNSSYYVLTGESTIFNGSIGCRIGEITDGTSTTFLVVEARRDIPWTRPDDIPFDPTGAFPTLGDYHAEGFSAARADGSVAFYAKSVDEGLLRATTTKAGGEPNQR